MIETESALELLGLGGGALEAVLGQEWAHLFLEKGNLLGLKGLPACGEGEKQAHQGWKSEKLFHDFLAPEIKFKI